MPPLTLEQVLARSMRLPRQRAQSHVATLYRGQGSANTTATAATSSSSSSNNGARLAQHATRTAALTAEISAPSPHHPIYRDGGASGSRAPSGRQERLSFFDLMDREEAARQAGRLSIHRSGHLVRNSADLTTFLNAAARTGDWEGGLRAFAEATALPAIQAMLPSSPASASLAGADAGPQSGGGPHASVSLTGVNPTSDQIRVLLDMCGKAGQLELVERIGAFFAPVFPEAFARAVELIAASSGEGGSKTAGAAAVPSSSSPSPSSSSFSACGWRAAFAYLTERCPLPAADIPVEAYNVCLRACEQARDWRGALEVIRAMGPNPLQGWTAVGEGGAHATRKPEAEAEGRAGSDENGPATAAPDQAEDTAAAAAAPSSSSSSSDASPPSISTPPVPNVVSYATLIATLEQAGKDQIASEVLNRLPAVEKEEITASYAALIFVWSNQVLKKQRRRF